MGRVAVVALLLVAAAMVRAIETEVHGMVLYLYVQWQITGAVERSSRSVCDEKITCVKY